METEIDRQRLAAALRPQIEKKHGSAGYVNLVRVSLLLTNPDGSKAASNDACIEEPVREGNSKALLISVDDLIDKIVQQCDTMAEGWGGMIRFLLRCYAGNERAVFSITFAKFVDETTDIDLSTGRPMGDIQPSRRSEFGMELSHRSKMFDATYRMSRDFQRDMMDENKRLRAHCAMQDAMIMQMHAAQQEAQSQALQRDIMLREAAEKREMGMQLLQKIMAYLPMFVQVLAGNKGQPIINTGSDPMFDAIVEGYRGLNSETKTMIQEFGVKLMPTLDDGYRGVLMKLLEQVQKKDQSKALERIASVSSSMPSLERANG